MPVHNADIAAVFEEIADLLEIQGQNAFRVRAYRNAARAIGDVPAKWRPSWSAARRCPSCLA